MAAKLEAVEMVVEQDLDPDPSYLDQDGFEDRRKAYYEMDFYFVGIRAVATIRIKDVIQTISSPGLWGIESDSGEEYFESVYADEKNVLHEMLAELGVKVPVS